MANNDRRDLIAVIVQDHQALQEAFVELETRVGSTESRRALADHAEAERVMRKLERVDVGDPLFEQLLGQLIRDVRNHIQDEENNLLPRLRSVCSDAELRELGKNVVRAKEVAPTRPHPYTPHRPPANLILGPGVGIIDKIRDRLRGRHT